MAFLWKDLVYKIEKVNFLQKSFMRSNAGLATTKKFYDIDHSSGDSSKPMGLTFGLASTKISFGLYEGHLPIDHASYTKYHPYSNFPSPSLTLLALVF